VEETKSYIKEWKSTKWFGEHEVDLADRILEVLEAEDTEEIVTKIDEELGVWENSHPWSMNFLLDVRNMVRPIQVEEEEEECTPTEADSPSALVP
jgi:hypothetical protein